MAWCEFVDRLRFKPLIQSTNLHEATPNKHPALGSMNTSSITEHEREGVDKRVEAGSNPGLLVVSVSCCSFLLVTFDFSPLSSAYAIRTRLIKRVSVIPLGRYLTTYVSRYSRRPTRTTRVRVTLRARRLL